MAVAPLRALHSYDGGAFQRFRIAPATCLTAILDMPASISELPHQLAFWR